MTLRIISNWSILALMCKVQWRRLLLASWVLGVQVTRKLGVAYNGWKNKESFILDVKGSYQKMEF